MSPDQHIYLDYAATTPVHPIVLEVMQDSYQKLFGNPSSLYKSGRLALQSLDHARLLISELLGATSSEEIVFTGSGSEADNLAIIGAAQAYQEKGNHIITSSIEHHAVLHTCQYLEKSGFEVSYLPVDQFGLVQPEELAQSIRPETTLVSIMHSNNEVGTIQPICELAKITHEKNILFHSDAVQGIGQIPINVNDLGVDLLTISGHKFYGPKGVGVLFIRDGVKLEPLIHGGSQERSRRAGTENVPGIVGTAKALELVLENLSREADRLSNLRDNLWNQLSEGIEDIRLNGHPTERLPNNLNVCFKNVEAEGLLLQLNRKGVEASMGSACNSELIEPSHVIQALNIHPDWERGALRLTLGNGSSQTGINYAAGVIIDIVNELQIQLIKV